MSDVNIPLLRKAVEWVEQQDKLPEAIREWNQSDWAVGFVYDPKNLDEIQDRRSLYRDALTHIEHKATTQNLSCGTAYCVAGWISQINDPEYSKTWSPPGKLDAEFYAMRLLGLTKSQANTLFDSDNSAADIRAIAEGIAGEKL